MLCALIIIIYTFFHNQTAHLWKHKKKFITQKKPKKKKSAEFKKQNKTRFDRIVREYYEEKKCM